MKLKIIILATAFCLLACNRSEEHPNFLIVFTDDQRVNTLGCYDENCPIQTPNLDQLASCGIKFTNGFVTTPICTVSRACLLTGQYVTNNRLHQFVTPMEDDVFEKIYPQYLQQAGYFIGNFGKYGIGITKEQEQVFDVFEGTAYQGPAFRDYKGKKMHDAEWLTEKAEEFIDMVPEGQPFCLQLNYKEPHPSSQPATEDDTLLDNFNFNRQLLDTDEAESTLPEFVRTGYGVKAYFKSKFNTKEGMNKGLRQYYEKIVSLDRSVGKLRKIIKERGLAENTVIIYLSDHGTHHGERHLLGKWSPYEESLKVPFIVYDPRTKSQKGAVLDDMVLNIDVAPTLLEMAGIEVPETMDGRSMKSLIEGKEKNWRDHFFFEHYCSPCMVPFYIPRNVGVRFKTAKYVRWIEIDTDPSKIAEEYYDLSNDPQEAQNLADNVNYLKQIDNARQIFDQWRAENPSSFKFDHFGHRAQFGSPIMDWEQFKKEKPQVYKKIENEIKRLGVDWNMAMNDWKTRLEICTNITYWY